MRGQATFEFILVMGAVGIVFLAMLLVSSGANSNLVQSQASSSAKRDAAAYASAINLVYLAGEGASFEFNPRLVREDHEIVVSEYSVSSMGPEASAGSSLLIGQVNETLLPRGSIAIRNSGGGIDIEIS